MQSRDVNRVLQIIRQHDEDDFEEARETYRHSIEGQFVLTVDNNVVGATGAENDEETDQTWWLSWTYLDEERQGTGLGAVMLVKMLDQMREWGARKVFVSTSDYVDLSRGEVYRDAMTAYKRLGFVEELRHANYYERNEAQIILGYRVGPDPLNVPQTEPDQRAAVLLGYDEIPETDSAFVIDWEFTDDEGSTTADVEDMITHAENNGGRVLFISMPSDATRLMSLLQTAGFMEEGRLQDFYEDGLDDVRRIPNRGHYDKATVYQILDSAFLCHVGFSVNDQPFVVPTLYGREQDNIYLHGSAASRMLKHLAKGIDVCLSVALVDGLVLARSAFHHSMNYRSATIFGTAIEIEGDEKEHGLFVISENVLKGRWQESRAPNPQELKATTVLRLEMESASAKVRTGPPGDEEEDYALPIWAGVVPITQTYGSPVDDPKLSEGIDIAPSVTALLDAQQSQEARDGLA
eukprot:g21444.t1